MARPIAAVVFTLGCLQASAVSALGLGELTLDSFLNEPFKARVDLLNTEGLSEHQIRIRLATTDDFDRMGVDRAYFLTSITFEIEIDDEGRGKILLSSEAPVLEPFLDFIVEARWPSGRLLREYTVLVDPPVFDSNQTYTISASEVADAAEPVPTAKKKSQQQSNNGTQVSLGKSNLGAGEMPQRNFGSDASPTALAGDRYMIRRDETLWGIAQKAKPEGTSVHQTMLDIQRLNPKAFIGGNINRIKAGYIIYLPAPEDISSDDIASAIEEVRQQNQDWHDNVSASGGGSLRISSSDASDNAAPATGDRAASSGSVSDMASLEKLDRSERDLADVEQRLNAMNEQVNTLERIVSVKDDQIAALQAALAEATAAEPDGSDASYGDNTVDDGSSAEMEVVSDDTTSESNAQPAVEAENPSEPAVEVATKPPTKVTKEEGGLFGSILLIGGLLLAAGIAVWAFLRKRSNDSKEELASEDVFADIQLEDQNLEVVADADAESKAEPEQPSEEPEATPSRGRGYGERKHDEYASDADSVDALAEADIYIAYGRLPQAVDLLKTAIESEPGNPAYKLKLMEVSADLGDQAEVMKQYGEVKSLGDTDSLSRADEIMRGEDGSADTLADTLAGTTDGSTDNPLALSEDLDLDLPDMELGGQAGDVNLEEEFGELEIEGFDSELSEDDLDLSKDFSDEPAESVLAETEEDMVFATEGDAVSTKLDLARAYLDMGDQDGARAIFEEIVAEGNAEQKQEALALLERLG